MPIQLNYYYINVRTSGQGISSCFFHKKIKKGLPSIEELMKNDT